MKKFIALFLAVLMLAACFAGCAKDESTDSAYVAKNKKLIVGITDYAPMDYKDANGNWTGFDAEFATLFAKELGVEVEFFVIADWSKKFVELDTKNIDCVWNGMTITNEALLKEANLAIRRPVAESKSGWWLYSTGWACAGAGVMALLWYISTLL